jgi:PTS system mannose-specific IIA component
MIGLVLVTHGNLADELVKAMVHVVGHQEQVVAICIGPDDNLEERRHDILTALNEVGGTDGVMVVTDMFGGTPSNLAISIIDYTNVEVIAGVNLPMLVKFTSCRDKYDLNICVKKSQEAGKKYITVASELLAKEKNSK